MKHLLIFLTPKCLVEMKREWSLERVSYLISKSPVIFFAANCARVTLEEKAEYRGRIIQKVGGSRP